MLKHHETIVSAIHELIDSGQVKTGDSVVLDTVPIPFLQEAPLLNRKWLDHHEAVLAEWGMLVKARGYIMKEQEDQHPLADIKCVLADGKECNLIQSGSKTGRNHYWQTGRYD